MDLQTENHANIHGAEVSTEAGLVGLVSVQLTAGEISTLYESVEHTFLSRK